MFSFFRTGLVNKCILFIYHYIQHRHLVSFRFSSKMSHRCKFEGMNAIGKNTSFYGYLGFGSYIGENSTVSANVGRFTSIGPGCSYINAYHTYKPPFVSTSPLFSSLTGQTPSGKTFAQKQMIDEFRYYEKEKKLVNKIGNDVWIGSNVTLIGGIEINDGAVVLAHAVVTKNVPPYAIVGGIPARILGYRFDEDTIKFLLAIKWWNNNKEWFQLNSDLMCNIEALKDKYKNYKHIS